MYVVERTLKETNRKGFDKWFYDCEDKCAWSLELQNGFIGF